jgi:hypothetical protein
MEETVIAYDYVFPVIAGDSVPASGSNLASVAVREVYGTAFCLFENFFVTNEHVIKNASEHTWWGLAFAEAGVWKAASVDHYERVVGLDIGILSASLPSAKWLKWRSDELSMLADVQTTGFPYGLDVSSSKLRMRSFRGTVVSSRTWDGLAAKPRVYELSFPCPRGLSGSPLWKPGNPPSVAGVVFGNSITEMIVNRDVEKTKEGSETTVYERVEALHLGMAIQTQSILSVQSSLFGLRIGDLLRDKDLLDS